MIGDFAPERELGARTVGQGRVDLRGALRDAFSRALGEFDDEVVEFGFAIRDVRDDLFVLGVIDEHRRIVPVTGDVLDIDVVFDRVDPLVTDEVAFQPVEEFLDLICRQRVAVLREHGGFRPGGDAL